MPPHTRDDGVAVISNAVVQDRADGGNRAGKMTKNRAARIPPMAWEYHRDKIMATHRTRGMRELIEVMNTEEGFSATQSQYFRQLRKWKSVNHLHETNEPDKLGLPNANSHTTNKAQFRDKQTPSTPEAPSSFRSGFDSAYHSVVTTQDSQDSCVLTPEPPASPWNIVDSYGDRFTKSRDQPWNFTGDTEAARYNASTSPVQQPSRPPTTPCIFGAEEYVGDFPSLTSPILKPPPSQDPSLDPSLLHLYQSTSFPDSAIDLETLDDSGIGMSLDCQPTPRVWVETFWKETPSSPIPAIEARIESFNSTASDHEALSELDGGASSECSLASFVDLSTDVYRSLLERFLIWVDAVHAPQLIRRFQHRQSPLPSNLSFKSSTTNDTNGGSSATPSSSTTNSTPESRGSIGKRAFYSANGPAERTQIDDKASPSPSASKKRKLKLACHFHKRNPGKFSGGRYKTCPNGFDGINRLKDHQNYVHRPAYYCKRCKLIFKSQDLKDAHDDQDVRCERREDPEFEDYLTTDIQRAALARKKPPRTKDEVFWFEMWDKYFSGVPRPTSAYQDLDPILVEFQGFAERETSNTIQAYNAQYPGHGLTDEELTEFWQFAIYNVVASFASQMGSQPPSSSPSQADQQQQQLLDADFGDLLPWPLPHSGPTDPVLDLLDFDSNLDDSQGLG